MNRVLEVENLSCTLQRGGENSGLTLVDEVSFSLFSHKTLALVGESGSGKTTTALSLLRLFPFYSRFEVTGKILFNGKNIVELTEKELRSIRGSGISMIFQDPSSALNPVFSIGDQVAEICEIHLGLTREEAEAKAIRALERVGLPRANKAFTTYPHELSGGMRQRVMIAMGLIASPQVLIGDEPTTALDVTVQKEILQLLKDLQKEEGMALLIITHDIGVVGEMADEVAVMYAGEIIEFGSKKSVFALRMHPYTQALFNARVTPERRKKPLPVVSGIAPSAGQRPDGCPFHTRCPFVMEKCRSGKVPKFYATDDKSHWARCWLYDHT